MKMARWLAPTLLTGACGCYSVDLVKEKYHTSAVLVR